MLRNVLLPAALTAVAVLSAPVARAESHPIETVALGWQVEHCDVAFVGRPTRADRPEPGVVQVTFALNETLVGALPEARTVVVTTADHGHAAGWRPGKDHLVFVERQVAAPHQAPRLVPVSGTFGLRMLDAGGPSARFPQIVRDLAATLSAERDEGRRTVTEPDRLRALLVQLLTDEDDGIALSGALDLVRHHALHDGLDAPQRESILTAYRTRPIGKRTKPALAAAVGITRHADADDALVQSLLEPRGGWLRGAVGEALYRLDSPQAEGLLLASLTGADDGQTRALLGVLGRVGTARSAALIREHLAHEDVDVRLEAAHALGSVARNVRKADADSRVSGRLQVEERLRVAESAREQQALVWALAQFDTQEAYRTLRTLAKEDEREAVRGFAERYLRRPRQMLVLR